MHAGAAPAGSLRCPGAGGAERGGVRREPARSRTRASSRGQRLASARKGGAVGVWRDAGDGEFVRRHIEFLASEGGAVKSAPGPIYDRLSSRRAEPAAKKAVAI